MPGGKIGMDLTTGRVSERLLIYSTPIIAANLLQQLYSMVDLIVIGQYLGSVGTVGVSVGGELIDFVTPVATAFAGAAQIYIAQLFGSKNTEKIKTTTYTFVSFMLLLAIALMLLSFLIHRQMLEILNCPEEAFQQADRYLLITACGLPFVFGYNAVSGMLRGIGETKYPLLFVACAAVVNIAGDIFFVAVLKMGAAGTALATVLSQLGSFIASVYFLYRKRERLEILSGKPKLSFDKETMRVLLELGVPKMLQALGVRVSLMWCQANINSYGLVAASVNSIGSKMQKLITVIVTGVDQGAGTMNGQNLGAKKYDRVTRTTWLAFGLCMGLAFIGSVMALAVPQQLFRIFTTDKAVISEAPRYMKVMVITYFSAALLGPFESVITGCGYARFNFVIGMLDGVVCRIGESAFYAWVLGMGVYGFYLGNATARIIPGVIALSWFLSGRWKKRKLLVE